MNRFWEEDNLFWEALLLSLVIHFALFPYLMVGHQISDVVAVLGSLNIIAAELDR